MKKLRRITVALLLASCPLLPACVADGVVCGAVGGIEGLRVAVSISGGLPSGAYTTVIHADGQELVIDELLQADGSVSAQPIPDVVVQGKHLYADSTLFARSGEIVVGYREGGGPATLDIEIRRGATVLAAQSYTPTYAAAYPNGEGCPPEVEQANGTLVFAAP